MAAHEIRRTKVLKKWVRFSLLMIIVVVLFASLILIKNSFTAPTKASIEYSYNIKQNVDYKVYLYENTFMDKEFLGKDEIYIADLIKNMEISFNYDYSGSKVVPVKYEYEIIGNINGEYQLSDSDDTKIWNKKYTLLNKQSGEISDTNNIKIKEKLDVDYKYYDDIVANFRKELKISIDATFDIVMTISIYGTNDLEGRLLDTKTMIISIPLNSQVFKISNTYEQKTNNNINSSDAENSRVDNKKLFCGVLIGITAIIMFVGLFNKIFNIKKKNPYNIKLNKILKDYGDIIIEVVNPSEKEGLNTVEVKNFNEMIDLEEELRIPIMFYETYEDLEGEFTLIHGNIMYKFVLDNENQ